jgi:hypothetical protein
MHKISIACSDKLKKAKQYHFRGINFSDVVDDVKKDISFEDAEHLNGGEKCIWAMAPIFQETKIEVLEMSDCELFFF